MQLHATFQKQGFIIIGISLDRGDIQMLHDFVKRHNINYLIGLDTRQEAASQYGVRGTPTSYLISPQGKVLGGAQGPRQWNSDAAKKLVKYLLGQTS